MFNGPKLQEYLDKHNLSREAFGRLVSTSGTMITLIIQGRKQPSLGLLKAIAITLGCTTDELII